MFENFRIPDPSEHAPLRETVRRFVATELDRGAFLPRVNSWMVHDRAFSMRCAGAGFVGMTLPARYGGGDRSLLERHVVAEELLAAGAPLAAHWIADRQSGAQILRYGSEAIRQRLLPEIAAGRCCFAIGMSEPDVGSDLAAVRMRAQQVADGWRLHGSKLWTSNADKADWLIALCRTAPAEGNRHAGLTQVLVDLRRAGVRIRTVENIAGDHDFCEVHFDDYPVHHEEVLGTPGEGWPLVMQELALERSGPDRYLTTFPLLAAALRDGALPEGEVAGLGRMVARLTTLQAMSIAVAESVAARRPGELEAALVKDAGARFEQAIPDFVRDAAVRTPRRGGDALEDALARATLYSPSFSLRGGTREILHGIIARGVGLR
jgi:acyl-CoA dehydrogenase